MLSIQNLHQTVKENIETVKCFMLFRFGKICFIYGLSAIVLTLDVSCLNVRTLASSKFSIRRLQASLEIANNNNNNNNNIHIQEFQLYISFHQHKLHSLHLFTVELTPFFVPLEENLGMVKVCICA